MLNHPQMRTQPKIPQFLLQEPSVKKLSVEEQVMDIERQLRAYERAQRQYQVEKRMAQQMLELGQRSGVLGEMLERLRAYELQSVPRRMEIRKLLRTLAELEEQTTV